MTMKHEMQSTSETTFLCACGVVGAKSEIADHLAGVAREEADAMLANAWTLVIRAEERPYTGEEVAELVATIKLSKLPGAPMWSKPTEPQRPNKVDQHRIDHGDFVRTSGDVYCKICGHIYYDHPAVVGFEWLRRACDGRLLKL